MRTVEEIEADLDATRQRLAGRLDDLQQYVAPKNVMNRQVAKVKGVFVDEYGGVKPDRVLMAAGVVVVIVGLRLPAPSPSGLTGWVGCRAASCRSSPDPARSPSGTTRARPRCGRPRRSS